MSEPNLSPRNFRLFLYIVSSIKILVDNLDKEDLKATEKELDKIIGSNAMDEFNEAMKVLKATDRLKQTNCSPGEREEAINIMAQYRNREKQIQPEKKIDPDSAILDFYERQMIEPEPKPIRRGKKGTKPSYLLPEEYRH